MPTPHGPDPQETGERVQRLLDELGASAGAEVGERAEELVRALMDLYGAGLARIVELVGQAGDDQLLTTLGADGLVGALLVLHDLHPQDVEERVSRALDEVRPYLGSHAGGVELLGVDDDAVVHLRLEGSCDGCPSSTVTVKYAIERAIGDAAPEITGVHVEGLSEPDARTDDGRTLIPAESLLRPPSGGTGPDAGRWATVDDAAAPAPGGVRAVEIDGARVLVCHADGTLYAYRNGCPGCGATWADGRLDGTELSCAGCGVGYDVRLAGRETTGVGLHLDPLPLLAEGDEIRIAVGAVGVLR